jgi:hypothetical protein
VSKEKTSNLYYKFAGVGKNMATAAVFHRKEIVNQTVISTICTREFENGVKRVGKRDYSQVNNVLQTETQRSITSLHEILKQKKRITKNR